MPRPLWLLPPPSNTVETSDKRALLTGFYWGGSVTEVLEFCFSAVAGVFNFLDYISHAFNAFVRTVYKFNEEEMFTESNKQLSFLFDGKTDTNICFDGISIFLFNDREDS